MWGTTLEARDTEITIAFWKQKAEQFGGLPPIAEFSLIDFVTQPFRFMILADLLASGDSVFLAYGPGFAKLFGLPERPSMLVPMLECVPDRYRPLFAEGCGAAIAETMPVRFNGEIARSGGAELYRACFMPLKMGINSMLAVYGSFNFLFCTPAELVERHQTEAEHSTTPSKLFERITRS